MNREVNREKKLIILLFKDAIIHINKPVHNLSVMGFNIRGKNLIGLIFNGSELVGFRVCNNLFEWNVYIQLQHMSVKNKTVQTRLSAFKKTKIFEEETDYIVKKCTNHIGSYIDEIDMVRERDVLSESKCRYPDPIKESRYVRYTVELRFMDEQSATIKTFSVEHITAGDVLTEHATLKLNVKRNAANTQVTGKPNLYLDKSMTFIGDNFIEHEEVYYYNNRWLQLHLVGRIADEIRETEEKFEKDEEWRSEFDPKVKKQREKRLKELREKHEAEEKRRKDKRKEKLRIEEERKKKALEAKKKRIAKAKKAARERGKKKERKIQEKSGSIYQEYKILCTIS